jgi:hypothetical protein
MGFSKVDDWPWETQPKRLGPKPKDKTVPTGLNCVNCNRRTMHSVVCSCACVRAICLICDLSASSLIAHAYLRQECSDCIGY